MTEQEFFDSCISDVLTRMRGYEDSLIDQWQMARYNAYMVYCSVTENKNRVNIYEFHSLPGDPTKEEIARIVRSPRQAMIERAIKKGYLKGKVKNG